VEDRLRGAPVVWFISYQHSLRPDEAGVKFAGDQSEATAEKQDLESRGYVVTEVAQSSHASAAAEARLAGPPPTSGSRRRALR
jgi:hypothetical protein